MLFNVFIKALFFSLALCQDLTRNDHVATKRCFECIGRRNHKDLYDHPTDCHKYYQCFYSGEENKAIGIERHCPSGQFWNEVILQCVPEGREPCKDLCQDHEMQRKGCYSDKDNCASYFVCSSWTSYPLCCPANTAFNEETCSCESSDTCRDKCTRKPVQPATTTKSVQVENDEYCIDSWDNKIFPDADSNFFNLAEEDGTRHRVECAKGSKFSLDRCSCDVNIDLPLPTERFRHCNLFLPFEDDGNDHSIHNYYVDIVPPARVSTEAAAHGNSSLRLERGGQVELPFKKGFVFDVDSFSVCAFVRCLEPPCTFTPGGIVSTRDGRDSPSIPFVLSFQPGNKMLIEIHCIAMPPVLYEFELPKSETEAFIQICILGSTGRKQFYVNKELVVDEAVPTGCMLAPIHCPMTLGFDPVHGHTEGFADDLLECSYDIGEKGVIAHFEGKTALQTYGMVP